MRIICIYEIDVNYDKTSFNIVVTFGLDKYLNLYTNAGVCQLFSLKILKVRGRQSPHPVQNFWICPEFWTFAQNVQNIVQKFWTNLRGKKWGFGAISGKKLTVSGLNMTHNTLYHLNKVYIYILLTLFYGFCL